MMMGLRHWKEFYILLSICFLVLLSGCDKDSKNTGVSGAAQEQAASSEPEPATSPEPEPAQEKPEKETAPPEGFQDVSQIYGEWKVTKTIGEGYIYSDSVPEDCYIGGIITIQEDYIESKLPDTDMGKKLELSGAVNNPEYVIKMQDRDDFRMMRYGNYDSFGFESEDKVPFIKVKKGKKEWDKFGSNIWIKDSDHIVISGPQYFLAKRVEE